MRKQIVFAVSVFGSVAASVALFGAGVANAADQYEGKTYSEIKAALSQAGLKPVIQSRVGDTLPEDQCLVVRADQRSRISPDSVSKKQVFSSTKETVDLVLNCDGAKAAPATPAAPAQQ